MRRVTLSRPFTEGMVTDQPAHAIGARNSVVAQDGYSPQGVFRQRGGWEYDGTTADVADNLVGIYRASFVLADENRTLTCNDDGDFYIHNASAAGTAILTAATVEHLPRCVYNDELIFCAQDGQSGIRRYSGSAINAVGDASGSTTLTAGQATVSSASFANTGVTTGAYLEVGPYGFSEPPPFSSIRILERNSSTSFTVEGILAGNTETVTAAGTGTGWAFPCVSVYDAGTGSYDNPNDQFDGTGVKWTGGQWGEVRGGGEDGLLVLPLGIPPTIHTISTVSAASLGISLTTKTAQNQQYKILRRCPFKDAAAHKESFWGSGVAQYPSRVYVGPPSWNLAFPPGAPLPFDPSAEYIRDNPNDFLMDYIDVPTAVDSDPIIAILSSPNPLLVLKRNAVYGVFGSYPNFTVDIIADGIGCIDIRSAQSFDEGQFWAGEGGIYWYVNGQIRDLTAGKINREWRALTRDFDYGTLDYCSLGLANGHLIVHITTGGATTQRTYLCDLRDGSWQSRVSNFTPRYMFTSRVPGEDEKLLAVSDARQGRVIDFAPAINGAGTAKDDAGSAPRLGFTTTSALAQADGIEGNATFVDLDIHANVYDAGAAASTVLDISTTHGGGAANEADASKTLSPINSDTSDRIDRHSRRIGRKGRLHSLTGSVSTLGTDTAATKVEVHQIVATVRDHRRRS